MEIDIDMGIDIDVDISVHRAPLKEFGVPVGLIYGRFRVQSST